MKEAYISYETAKIARYKGFDIRQDNYYFEGILDNDSLGRTASGEIIEAPTQQFLQRYLREKHNIIVSIIPHFYGMKAPYTIKYNYRIFVHNDVREFDSYEDCLEMGLLEALNEIKN